jgi:hypothetical protein
MHHLNQSIFKKRFFASIMMNSEKGMKSTGKKTDEIGLLDAH